MTRPCNNQQNKKKRTCQIVDFAVPADHRVKLKESEKNDKYLDLARELKKLRNMKVTVLLSLLSLVIIPDLGQMTRPRNQQIKKEDLPNCGLCCPGWPQSKTERKRKER